MFSNRLDLTDRVAIEYGISAGKSMKQISKEIGKSPSTISREIRNNREFIAGTFFLGNDCKYSRMCKKKHVCGNKDCGTYCIRCRTLDCRQNCLSYKPYKCTHLDYPPYVCSHCMQRRDCCKNRYFYSAKAAQRKTDKRRSQSRQGVRLDDREIELLNSVIEKGIRKGQPLSHIYEQHKDELSVSLRSLYNYIDAGLFDVRNIDLPKKVVYRKRRAKSQSKRNTDYACRKGRTYEDFNRFVKNENPPYIVEMDTVKSKRGTSKTLLTMIFRDPSFMFIFLLPDGTLESVLEVFDYLTHVLGLRLFKRLIDS